jgi:hypothetical protein
MSSKRHLRRKSCERKHRYKDRLEATGAARFTHEKHGGVVDVYHCKSCGGWHVGHAPGFIQRRARMGLGRRGV